MMHSVLRRRAGVWALPRSVRSPIALVVLAAVLVGAWVLPAGATTRTEKTFGSWTVACVEQDGQPKRCAMRQSRAQSGARARGLILIWTITADPQNGVVQSSLGVPAGVSIKEGVRLFIGDAEPITIAYEACGPRICVATMPLDSRLLTAMTQGTKASANYVRATKQLVQVQLDLTGFREAYEYLLEQVS